MGNLPEDTTTIRGNWYTVDDGRSGQWSDHIMCSFARYKEMTDRQMRMRALKFAQEIRNNSPTVMATCVKKNGLGTFKIWTLHHS
jgi:hypothetical protein